MVHSLSQRLVARYFAGLLVMSGIVSAVVHPLPNLTDMSGAERGAITLACLLGGLAIWFAPWDRWPRSALLFIPPIGLGIKMWANLHGGLGPFSYSIHFALVYVWMGVALPRWTPLAFTPLLAIAYVIPLLPQDEPGHIASVAIVLPICVLIGESVAWISAKLREVERVDAQHMQRLEWLVAASGRLAILQDPKELTACVAELATELPSASGSAVLLSGPSRSFEVVASDKWPGTLPDHFLLSEHPALIEAMRRGEFLGADHEICAALGKELDVPRLGVAPLLAGSRCIGLILLARPLGAAPFDAFTSGLVRTLIAQAGLAIERVRDREALRDASLHDELTGLGNRRKANMRLDQLKPGDALLILDLDRFKQVNDTYGHAEGDDVLRKLAGFLSRAPRESDQAFRMGGEEFLIVLEGAGAGARTAAERLLQGWRFEEPITTFSAGVCVHEEGMSPEETLERADAALYAAKNAGRDRVICA